MKRLLKKTPSGCVVGPRVQKPGVHTWHVQKEMVRAIRRSTQSFLYNEEERTDKPRASLVELARLEQRT